MWRRLSVCVVAVSICLPAAADEFSDCQTGNDVDRVITACTKLIDSGGGYFDPSTAPKSISIGMRGPQIGALQLFLSRSGYAVGTLDEVYGPATHRAATKAKRDLRQSTQELVLHSVRQLSLSLAHYKRGISHLAKGDDKQAITDFDESIRLNPGFVDALANRGVAHADSGQLGRAISDYDQAIALDPYLADAYAGRGAARLAMGDTNRAIEDLDRAISLDPKLADAYVDRADALVKKGDYDRAVDDSNQAILLDPDLPGGYYTRALGYVGKGDLVNATIDLRLVSRLFPDDALWQDRVSARTAEIEELQSPPAAQAASATSTPPTAISDGGIIITVSSALVNSEPITRLWIEGDIRKGDERVLDKALLAGDGDPTIVFLNSLDGDIEAAVAIGRTIRGKKLVTGVVERSTCVSACALVWLAGRTRFAEPGVSIGFRPLEKIAGREPDRHSLVSGYLGELGFGSGAISYMTEMEAGETSWLGPLDAMRFGIYYEEWDFTLEPAGDVAG